MRGKTVVHGMGGRPGTLGRFLQLRLSFFASENSHVLAGPLT